MWYETKIRECRVRIGWSCSHPISVNNCDDGAHLSIHLCVHLSAALCIYQAIRLSNYLNVFENYLCMVAHRRVPQPPPAAMRLVLWNTKGRAGAEILATGVVSAPAVVNWGIFRSWAPPDFPHIFAYL